MGENLHARYILTEKGGLRFDHGLDDKIDENGKSYETTDVECLEPALHALRREQFRGGSSHFELVDAWIVTATAVTKAIWDGNQFAPESPGTR